MIVPRTQLAQLLRLFPNNIRELSACIATVKHSATRKISPRPFRSAGATSFFLAIKTTAGSPTEWRPWPLFLPATTSAPLFRLRPSLPTRTSNRMESCFCLCPPHTGKNRRLFPPEFINLPLTVAHSLFGHHSAPCSFRFRRIGDTIIGSVLLPHGLPKYTASKSP